MQLESMQRPPTSGCVVRVQPCPRYDPVDLDSAMEAFRPLFEEVVRPGDRVVLKPNWLAHRHKYRREEWLAVITHPTVITAVLRIVLDCLHGSGEVVITDGPQTDSSWAQLMQRMTPDRWLSMGKERGVTTSIVDLREHEWETRGDVNVMRRSLSGDPMGSTCVDLGTGSEFDGHVPSRRGYYGADYDVAETNQAHSGGHHKYKVSRTAIMADVFVNLPKMKTHKKAGITCSLKNLVGINTYKNWLPHHNEGTPAEGGDQFPFDSTTRRLEGAATDWFKTVLSAHPPLGRWFVPVKYLGRKVFGETSETIRSGNWYGNDTLWRMVLDLNKVLLYANPDGSLRRDSFASRKRYISIVDGIVAGEGNGPEAPDAKSCGLLIGGLNGVAVDAACAKIMGLDWLRIPSIRQAFDVRDHRLCDFSYLDVELVGPDQRFRGQLANLPSLEEFRFRPHFGWLGHVEIEGNKISDQWRR